MKLSRTPDALAELQKLLEDLAEESPQGAVRVGLTIQKAEQTLIEHPYIGQLTTARLPPVRRLVLRPFPYILFYELSDDEIIIIGIRHGARNPATMPGNA